MGKFNFNESPVAKVAEEIRDGNNDTLRLQQTQGYGLTSAEAERIVANAIPQPEQGRVEQPAPQPAPQQPTPQPQQPATAKEHETFKPLKTKKTENGIVINVPMQDYMQLTMMKMQTGRTLKDLALQAIHEFIENHQEVLR